MIVTALATGAVAALKPAAEDLVKSGYTDLKMLLHNRFSSVDLTPLEQKPASKAKQESLAEDLMEVEADKNAEILRAAQNFIKLIENRAPEAAISIGIDLERLRAGGSINIENVVAQEIGVRGKAWEAESDINIKGVRVGHGGLDHPND